MASKNKNLLSIGDKVDLYLGTGPVYLSKLEDITQSGNLLVSIPTYQGVPVNIKEGQGFQLYFYRTNGRYRVNVKMNGYVKDGHIRLMELKPLSDPQRQQRRDPFRLPIDLKVLVTNIEETENKSITEDVSGSDKTEQVSSINLSATGIAIASRHQYSLGDRVNLQIYLNWPEGNSGPIELIGEVRQVTEAEPLRRVYCGLRFLYLSNDTYSHLYRFIMSQEQKRLRQKRLVEGD